MHPFVLVALIPLVAGPAFFLIGTGVWISLKVRHTTTAVLLNIGLGLLVWLGIPILLLLVGEVFGIRDDLAKFSFGLNPCVWICELLDQLSESHAPYWTTRTGMLKSWLWRKLWGGEGFVAMETLAIFLWALSSAYAYVGLTVIRRAAARVRGRKPKQGVTE